MKNQHQIDEMHLSRVLKERKKHSRHSFYNASDESDLIICPFCYSMTVYSFSLPNRCNVCAREITDADILNSYQD